MPKQKPSTVPFLFESSVREILTRLEGDRSPEALELRGEALGLAQIFRKWMVERPSDPIRHDAINRLFTLYRQTMNYILQR
jgi:hypothetical protein